jgi:hypothetical protein
VKFERGTKRATTVSMDGKVGYVSAKGDWIL